MRRRMFDNYQAGGEVEGVNLFEEEETVPSPTQDKKPSIMGAPMPKTGMRQKGMGEIFSPKQDVTPKGYAEENAAKKRMSQFGQRGIPDALTGRQMQAPQQAGQIQPQSSMGSRWLGEIWQDVTSEDVIPQQGIGHPGFQGPGYQSGGSVGSAMEVYNQTMRNLDSGVGFAHGGAVDTGRLRSESEELAGYGRNGDTMMMHINPAELQGLEQLFGPLSVNPDTGNPEAFGIVAGLLAGAALGGVAGGAAGDWKTKNILLGVGIGATLGATAGAASAPAAVAPASVPAVTAPTTVASTVGPGGLAVGEAAFAGGPTVTGFGTAPSLGQAAGLTASQKAGLSSLTSSGLKMAQGSPQQQQSPPPMVNIASSSPSGGRQPQPMLPGVPMGPASRRKPRRTGRIGSVLG